MCSLIHKALANVLANAKSARLYTADKKTLANVLADTKNAR
jgi:hypothetical protein